MVTVLEVAPVEAMFIEAYSGGDSLLLVVEFICYCFHGTCYSDYVALIYYASIIVVRDLCRNLVKSPLLFIK